MQQLENSVEKKELFHLISNYAIEEMIILGCNWSDENI